LTLLVVAGLFAKSLLNVGRVSLGMQVEDVATLRLSPELNGYTSQEAPQYFDRVLDALQHLPGVSFATASNVRVLAGARMGTNVTVQGFTPPPDADTSADTAA